MRFAKLLPILSMIIVSSFLSCGEEPAGSSESDNPNPGGESDPSTYNEDELLDIEYAKSPKRGAVSISFQGAGTGSDPYLIQSAADLRYLSDCVRKGEIFKGKYFRLTKDIVINQNVLNSNGELNGTGADFEQWIPIGRTYPSYFFCGRFYGENHTISGLYYNRENGEYGGLFGRVGGSGDVYNVIIKDSYFKGKNNIGALVGDISINREASTISSDINKFYEKNLSVSLIHNKSYATVIGAGNNIGGIVGRAYFGNSTSRNYNHFIWVMNCANYGIVQGQTCVGGLVGAYSGHSSDEGKLNALYNEGDIIATSGCAGGIIGKIIGAPCLAALNKGSVKGSLQSGGMFGYGIGVELSGCLNIGEIAETGIWGAICGHVRSGELEYSYFLNKTGLKKCGKNESASFSQVLSCTVEELKSTKIINDLKRQFGNWIIGSDGYPTLEWLSKTPQTKY